MLNEHIIIY